MCGVVGIIDLDMASRAKKFSIENACNSMAYRGPDDTGVYCSDNVILGFNRLSIVGIDDGVQPLYNGRHDVVGVVNGEIYNYKEIKNELASKGHYTRTQVDTEVIPFLYQKNEFNFLKDLNGQFAIIAHDIRQKSILLARDHFGICPLYYMINDGMLFVASEIKAILACSKIPPRLDMVALDQVLSFPGLVSPRTMFHQVYSVRPGESIEFNLGERAPKKTIYWDFDYSSNCIEKDKAYYTEGLAFHLKKSLSYRLNADVPVAFYLSGGLDSSLLLGMAKDLNPTVSYSTYSMVFPDNHLIDEGKYQRLMARSAASSHNELAFNFENILTNIKKVVYHAECPVKESFDTAAIALSQHVNSLGGKVIIGGQGADELLGGYPGYKFDEFRSDIEGELSAEEAALREKIWGDPNYFYEKNQFEFSAIKKRLYSKDLVESYSEFNALNHFLIDKGRIKNTGLFNKRSYIDFKLRLCDHLLTEHGDRMLMANSIEGRYPFLDQELVNFAMKIPPKFKMDDLSEKKILKDIAHAYIPSEIINREKFGFTAPGSPYLLNQDSPYIEHLLSRNTIEKHGVFNPDSVNGLLKQYSQPGFRVNVPFDDDYLMTIITTGVFMELFDIQGVAHESLSI